MELFCNDYGFPSAELLEDVGPSNPGKLSKKTKFAKLPKAKKQPKINKKPTKSIAPQSKMSFQVNETDAAFPKFVSDLEEILQFDQLLCQLSYRNVFEGFQESPIRFPPTFKYDKRKGSFDSSVKARCPAWTDRILHSTPHPKASGNADKGKLRLNQQEYYSVDARTSDHRPVCGIFEMVVPIDLNKLESNKKGKREKRN